MRTISTLALVVCLAGMPLAGGAAAKAPARGQDGQYQDQGSYGYEDYSPEQLDNLLAPIALYPDPLLAQVLIAATFPDQIQDAAVWVQRYGPGDRGLDDQNWDVSVRAVAHYPAVLNMMNDKIDWTTAVGQAYVNQSTDTMASIQNLRGLARSEGNLFSTPQQQVVVDGGYIQILPAQPQYIFVPTYDPGVIYSRRVYSGGNYGGFFSFGSGFVIGAWLNYDLDWASRRVVYNDWQRGGGWRQRSRPFVQVNNNVYINNRYQNVVVNRTVTNRQVNVQKVDQFNSVHAGVKFDDRARGNANRQPGRPNPGGNPNGSPNNDANRNPRTVQPSQPLRPADNLNPGGRGQPAPVVVPQQNNNDNRNGRPGEGQNQNQRGDNPRGVPPAAVQPAQPVQQAPVTQPNNQRQNNNTYRGGQNQGGQPATPDSNVRGRQQNQTTPDVPAAVPQRTPPVPQQNTPRQNDNRPAPAQAPPARVEPARPIPPAVQPTPQPAQRPAQEVEQERRVQQQQQRPAQEQKQAAPAPPAAQQPAQQQHQAPPAQQGGKQQDHGGNNGRNGKDNGNANKDNKDGKDH